MKIAIALEIHDVTLAHFGRAGCFAIYDDQSGAFRFDETRFNTPPCGQAETLALMSTTVRLLSDCDAVVAARFGPCAQREVAAAGIFPFEMQGILDQHIVLGLKRLRDYLLRGKAKDRGRINP